MTLHFLSGPDKVIMEVCIHDISSDGVKSTENLRWC